MADLHANPDAKQSSQPLVGIVWMLVTSALFVTVTASVKHGAAELPAAMSAFVRYFLGLVFFIPIFPRLFQLRLTRQQVQFVAIRGATHSLGVILWFFAMTRISIAEVTSMGYMTPVYVTLAAALFLGEKLAIRRLAAIFVAFIGALVILRPGLRELSDGHIAMIFSAGFFAISYLTAKKLADELPASVVVALLSVTVTIGLFPFALAVWRWPTAEELGWLCLIAVVATAGHYSMTRAFAVAPVSVTQPVTFTQLVWSVLVGYFMFSEAIDIWVILGGTLILLAATFIAIREAMLQRAKPDLTL